jgi:hypothetical protein
MMVDLDAPPIQCAQPATMAASLKTRHAARSLVDELHQRL